VDIKIPEINIANDDDDMSSDFDEPVGSKPINKPQAPAKSRIKKMVPKSIYDSDYSDSEEEGKQQLNLSKRDHTLYTNTTELDEIWDNFHVKKIQKNYTELPKDHEAKLKDNKFNENSAKTRSALIHISKETYPFLPVIADPDVSNRKVVFYNHVAQPILVDKRTNRYFITYKFRKDDETRKLGKLNLVKVDRGDNYSCWVTGNDVYEEPGAFKRTTNIPKLSYSNWTINPSCHLKVVRHNSLVQSKH